MNPVMAHDEPTPEFRAHLEWQIQTAIRRESRFSEPAMSRMPIVRTALIVTAALVIGSAGGLATGYAQESRERQQLVENARSEADLLKLRLELVRKDLEETRRRVETGTTGREALIAAEEQVRAIESSLARNQLDVAEILATSAAPRNDLQAPLVGERDFVRERMMLELAAVQRALVVAERRLVDAQMRLEIGVTPRLEVQQAEIAVAQTRLRMQMLGATLDLRARALKGDLKPDDTAPALRKLELTQQLQQSQQQLIVEQARLAEAKRRFEVGITSELDVKQAEVRILELRLEMKRLEQQLEVLRAKK